MPKYVVKGFFRMGIMGVTQKFCLDVDAKTEKAAIDKVYCLLGSNSQCKRRFVKVDSVNVGK